MPRKPTNTESSSKKPKMDEIEIAKLFEQSHPLYPHYCNSAGKIKRLISKSRHRKFDRTSKGAYRILVMSAVDKINTILNELNKFPRKKGKNTKGKKIRVTFHHLRQIFKNSPTLKSWNVRVLPKLITRLTKKKFHKYIMANTVSHPKDVETKKEDEKDEKKKDTDSEEKETPEKKK